MNQAWKSFARSGMKHRLAEIERLVESMNYQFIRDRMSLHEAFEREIENASAEASSELAEWYSESDDEVAEVFPRIFFQATFLSIWSAFEYEMVDLCRRDLRHESEADDPTTGERAEKIVYLRDVDKYWKDRKVTYPRGWGEIKVLSDVRNQIAHDIGRRHKSSKRIAKSKLSDRSDRVDRYVKLRRRKKKPGLTFKGDVLVLDSDFCVEIIKLMCELFDELVRRLPKTSEAFRRKKTAYWAAQRQAAGKK